MEPKTPLPDRRGAGLLDWGAFLPMLRYVLSFFLTMLATYLLCSVTAGEEGGSTAYAFTFAVAAGILGLLVCHAVTSDQPPRFRHYYIWMAGFFSFAAIMIAYIGLGVYPFGEKSVMIIDMHHQYSSFFSLVRERITTLDSLSYADSVGMGGGLLPLIAYYLSSPYNLVAVLFPREWLTEAIALIEVLKITSAGVTFALFCRGVFKKEDYASVAASVAYALSAYFIAYSWDVMWLDCLVLLPLIVWGLEKVMRGESPLLYCITLGLAITTNYYIGYMVCVFLVLWFIMRMLETGIPADRLTGTLTGRERALGMLAAVWRFAWTSCVGGMLSMWILLPTAISLRETSGAEDSFARAVTSNFAFWDILPRTLFGAAPTERGDNLPNIYCTLLAVLMLAVFLLCKRIRLRTRLCFGGLLGALVLLMANNWTNFAFHGFHFPNDLPYRNSFLVSFVMLAIAVQALEELPSLDRETLWKAAALCGALVVIEQKFGDAEYLSVWVSLGMLALYALVIGCVPLLRGAGKNAVVALLLAAVFAEATCNATVMLRTLNQNEVFTERESFVSDYDINKAAVSYVEEINSDGSRMELLPRKTCNDDALYDYPGLTVFASSNAKATTTLMGKLGYAINGVNSYIYNSYVPLSDSLLNLRYIAFGHDIGTHAQLRYLDKIDDGNGHYRYLYENTLALSRGFAVDEDIIFWDENGGRYENPFEVQNQFLSYAGNAAPVYTMLSPAVERESGLTVECSGSYFFADGDDGGSFTAAVTKERESQTYVYVDCRAASSINVTVGDSNWNVTPYEPYIIDLGKMPVGDTVRVEIDADSTCSGNIYIADLDTEALTNALAMLGENQWQISKWDDGFFSGSITVPDACTLFTSIPYNKGWTVWVDGQKVETFAIAEALLGVSLKAGTHQIEMKYHTPGFALGLTLTLLSAAILVLWAMREKWVWPLLREYVPVLYRRIEHSRRETPPNTPFSFEELFAAEAAGSQSDEEDAAANPFKAASGEMVFDRDASRTAPPARPPVRPVNKPASPAPAKTVRPQAKPDAPVELKENPPAPKAGSANASSPSAGQSFEISESR